MNRLLLNSVKIKNYRNYDQEEMTFGPGLNVFIGENAQGKTNLLEALYLCATLRSFRTRKDRELIKKEEDQAYIKLEVSSQEGEKTLEMLLKKDQKKRVKKNGLSVTSISDLLGTVKAVLFSPEDLKIVKDSPLERRQFMDSEIIQTSPRYYHSLKSYQKIVKQRNQLLKKMDVNEEQLMVWDQQLSEYASMVLQLRHQFLSELLALAKPIHQAITEGKEALDLEYSPGIKLPKDWYRYAQVDLRDYIQGEMERYRKKDLYHRTTHLGPHRDDIHFMINGMEVRRFGSQGQKRTVVLSLKLAVLEWVKKESGEYPVLMLDDVTSELDHKRQEYLLHYLKPIQTFITTTHFDEKMKKNSEGSFFLIQDGKIKKKTW